MTTYGQSISFVDELHYLMKDQVLGYVRSVEVALPSIFKDADVKFSDGLASILLFVAAVKKFYSICSGHFWAIDNSLTILSRQDTTSIRIGGSFMGKQSTDYIALRKLTAELDSSMEKFGLAEIIGMRSLSDILKRLASEYE